MNVGIISMRYAKALMGYAQDNKVEDEIYREMSTLANSFTALPELRSALDNPMLGKKEKLTLICNAAGVNVCKEFIRFVELVMREHREKHLQSMSLMYMDLYRKLKNISIGKLVTAWPVNKATEERMKQMIVNQTHGTVDFNVKVEPEIEGGFILEIGTYRLDASVATQFRRVKQQFIEKNRRIV